MDFRVKNFEQYQSYKDRVPTWIKLYNSLLDNYEFGSLSDASKGHLILIFLLASKRKNVLPWNPEWIASRIQAKSSIDLEEIESAGFIEKIPQENQIVRTYVEELTQVCALEERREEESRVDKSREESPTGTVKPSAKAKTHPRLGVFLEEYRQATGKNYVVGNYREEGGAASRTVSKIPDDSVYQQAVRAYLAAPDKRIVSASYPYLWFIRELNRWVGSAQGGTSAKFSGFERKNYSDGVF